MSNNKTEWEDNIDWGRLFRYLLSKWVYFVISIFAAYTIAIIFLKYQDPIYKVTSTILVNTSGFSLEKNLGGLDLSNEDRNLNNQISIIKSFKFIRKTLMQLDFGVSYFHSGSIRTVELYKDNIYRIDLDSNYLQLIDVPLYVSFIGNNKFRIRSLKPINGNLYNIKTNHIEENIHDVTIDFIGEIGQPCITDYLSFTLFLNSPDIQISDESEPVLFFTIYELDAMAQNYKNRLEIDPETKGSSILELSLSGPVLNKNIAFLNKLSDVYIQNSLDEKNKNVINTIGFIDGQLLALSKDLDLSEDERERFQRAIKSLDFHSNAKEAAVKLEQFEAKIESLKLQLNYYTYLKDYIETNKNAGDLVIPSAIGIDDGVLTSLIRQLIDNQTERSSILPLAGKTNPYLLQLEKKILLSKQAILENLKHSISSTQNSIDELSDKIITLEGSVENLPASERRYMEIERKFNVKDHLYNFLLVKRAEAGITQAANRPDHMVVEEARQLSAKLIAPKSLLIRNEAILIGFFIPLIFFSLRNILSDKIMSKEMIARLSQVPILGVVGHTIHKKSQFIVTDFPKSSVSEALRSIRINLNYLAPNVKNKSICITSSVSGEGKSFLSANLATLIAMIGNRVVMVGADMRKPAKFTELGLKSDLGLSSYLAGTCSYEECIQHTQVENLDFIVSGPVPPNPSELLSMKAFGDLIKRLSREYEFVIVDTPPVGLVSDAMLIFEYCDIHLFVVRYHYTSVSMLKRLDEIVKNTPVVKNAMVIFNDYVEISKKYYYNKGYGYYDEGFELEKNILKRFGKWTLQKALLIRKIIIDSLRV